MLLSLFNAIFGRKITAVTPADTIVALELYHQLDLAPIVRELDLTPYVKELDLNHKVYEYDLSPTVKELF